MSKYSLRLGGPIMFLLLLPGFVTLLASSTAEAQQRRRVYRPAGLSPLLQSLVGYRRWGYDPYSDYYSRYGHYVFDNSDKAYSEGYRDGQKTGAGDLKNHRTFNPQRSHYFQEAGFGNFGEAYRSGFVRVYADAFRV